MSIKKIFLFLVLLLFITSQKVLGRKIFKNKNANLNSRQQQQPNFHEVDAFGEDFVDFGAQTGDRGQFSWHADFPIE
jgi:hypothetical protein